MSVTIDGIISGFDTTALIDAILEASAAPMAAMEEQLEAEQATLDKITELSSLLEDLSTNIEELQGGLTAGFAATVAEGAGFTASTSSGAIAGIYSVDVTSLATSEMEVSQGFADPSAAGTLSQGTLTVNIAGTDVDVVVDGTNDSLDGLAASLNDVDGISAYVLNTGIGATPYQLVVSSDASGTANTLSFDTSGLVGAGTVPTFTETVAGADAQLTLNGLAVSSASNDVEAVPGLTLHLTEAGLGPSTVEVSVDNTTIEEQIQGFVDAYNEVINHYEVNSVYNAEAEIEGPLATDSTARRTVDQIGDIVSNVYAVDGGLSILAQIGISTEQDGTLSLDLEALNTALDDSVDDVFELITSDDGPLSALKTQIDDVYVDPDNGTLESRQDTLQDSIEDLQGRIDDEDERLADQAETLRGQFTAMEQAMAELQSTALFLTAFFTEPTT